MKHIVYNKENLVLQAIFQFDIIVILLKLQYISSFYTVVHLDELNFIYAFGSLILRTLECEELSHYCILKIKLQYFRGFLRNLISFPVPPEFPFLFLGDKYHLTTIKFYFALGDLYRFIVRENIIKY